MCPLSPDRFRDRALLVLAQLLGPPAEPIETGLSASVRLPGMRLVLAAGDQRKPLDAKQLRPVALAAGSDLLATYIDLHRHGHLVLFDLVLIGSGETGVHAGLSLWMAPEGTLRFVLHETRGPRIRVTAAGLVEASEPPFRTRRADHRHRSRTGAADRPALARRRLLTPAGRPGRSIEKSRERG